MGMSNLDSVVGINVVNSLSESWTGIGVVAGGAVVVLIRQGPHGKQGDTRWRIELRHRLQEVRRDCKTRNQLYLRRCISWSGEAHRAPYEQQAHGVWSGTPHLP